MQLLTLFTTTHRGRCSGLQIESLCLHRTPFPFPICNCSILPTRVTILSPCNLSSVCPIHASFPLFYKAIASFTYSNLSLLPFCFPPPSVFFIPLLLFTSSFLSLLLLPLSCYSSLPFSSYTLPSFPSLSLPTLTKRKPPLLPFLLLSLSYLPTSSLFPSPLSSFLERERGGQN